MANLSVDFMLTLIIQKKWALNHWFLSLLQAWQGAKTDGSIINKMLKLQYLDWQTSQDLSLTMSILLVCKWIFSAIQFKCLSAEMRNTVGREVSDREPGVGVTELTWQANRLPGTPTYISFSINRQKCILVKARLKQKFEFQEEKKQVILLTRANQSAEFFLHH